MNINAINFNAFQYKQNSKVTNPSPRFGQLMQDTVEISQKPVQNEPFSLTDSILNMLYGTDKIESLEPKHKGIIYKKVKDKNGKVIQKIPIEVDIVKSRADKFEFEHKGETIGYVELSYVPEDKCKDDTDEILYKNYKEEGVVGDRIIVNFLYNKNPDEYGGIAHLADLLEVAACKELGFEPNVVSETLDDAAPLHYQRGKRFVPYEKYCDERTLERLKGKNPNEIVKKVIEDTPSGEKFKKPALCSETVMYMPKDMIKELEEELKEHPIF
ncbi:hypothetical protein IJI31_02960 [bacterium]|nr:hypothetical protein [bacterium]